VEGVLASVDKVTRSPHNELGSKIWKKKESLHEELNSEI
jgi:hypothetical protein